LKPVNSVDPKPLVGSAVGLIGEKKADEDVFKKIKANSLSDFTKCTFNGSVVYIFVGKTL
jgi:hypothetical protein